MSTLTNRNYGLRGLTILLVIILTTYPASVFSLGNNSAVLVHLDPYVSILDKDNPFRYNTFDLLPLIDIFSTKFSKVYVELSYQDLLQETSLSKLPLAIAHHNAFTSNLTAPLEVWLSYKVDAETEYTNTSNSQNFHKLLSAVNKANTIFKETITTLLVPEYNLTAFQAFSENIGNLKIGSILDVQTKCNKTSDKDIYLNVPKLVLLPAKSSIQKHTTTFNVKNDKPENGFQTILKRATGNCRDYFSNDSILPIFIFSFPDTTNSGIFNKTRLVSLWNQADNWSRNSGTPVILSKAFDTPYETALHKKTNGWWRLVEDKDYQNTTDYIFVEKVTIFNQTEHDDNFVNVTWLMQDTKFNREYTGIVFNLYNKVGSKLATYTDQELQPIINQIEKYFSKITVLVQDNSIEWLQIIPRELKNLDTIRTNIEATLMVLPDLELHHYFSESLDSLIEGYQLPKDLLTGFVIPYTGSTTTEQANSIKSTLLRGKDFSKNRFGYLFPIKVCRAYDSKAIEERSWIQETLNDTDAQVIYFFFEEDEETVKLGARRTYEQRIVEFEECRKIIESLNFENSNNTLKTLRFIMLHYATDIINFYENAWAVQNLVKYWEMLSNWAGSTKTTVVLSSAIDATRIFKGENKKIAQVGWWRQLVNSTGSGVGAQVNKIWLNKKQDAFRIATRTMESNASKTDVSFGMTVDVFVVILLPLLGCSLVIALALYLMRRHYRSVGLNENEINNFFLGNENLDENQPDNSAHKVPYDKERYEITKDKFQIDEASLLGSGEFGKVCKGNVKMDDGVSINVAVKMANSEKIHKTTLNGMLSEIKVLAYLGKNENVIELIGANTEALRDGRVLIFMELCRLGSLEKCLRRLRPEIDTETNEDFNLESLGFDERYTNLVNVKKVNLDQELSDDLFRWSKEICSGMAFLAEKHVVHADLATRNVLLNLRKEAKICDFGLSRKLYNYTNYVKKHQEPLPWKWMSPESLRLLEFNEKSDVWAFGITMWEIYSLGDTPYPGLSFDLSFAQMLESGFRLGEPKFDDREMHAVMKKCWFTNPTKRPTFSDLLTELEG